MVSFSFNAGHVLYDEDTHKCTPLPHKGQITIQPSAEEEGFFDFIWAPKTNSGARRHELVLIPGDFSFKPVKSCTTGRVVALTFSSGQRSLYWLQDLGDEDDLDTFTKKDEEILAKFHAVVEAESEAEAEDAAAAAPAAAPASIALETVASAAEPSEPSAEQQ